MRYGYQTNRYEPGHWNGLHGWRECSQYFNRESEDRVAAMMDIATLLRNNGIKFTAKIWRRYYRISVTIREYEKIPLQLHEKIFSININHRNDW